MKITHIKDKLAELGVDVNSVSLGQFDTIGKFCAERQRDPNDPNYHKFGWTYRASYERGVLVYYLIRKHELTSMLEIGLGRGYTTLCAAKAFYDAGYAGKIVSVDTKIDEKFFNALTHIFPKDWFKYIELVAGPSEKVLPEIKESFDLAYIDGDHSYEGTKSDWALTKNKVKKFVLFDDYHLPTKTDAGIQCSRAINEIDWSAEGFKDPEMIRLDRRLFVDDRGLPDEAIDYGQCLVARKDVVSLRDDW